MRRNDSKRSALWGRGGDTRRRSQLALVVTAIAVAAANGNFLFAWLANWTW
jgi:hypothetical protein